MITTGNLGWFATICLSCLAFGHSGLFLVGAIFILIAGLIMPTVGMAASGSGSQRQLTPADLAWFPIKIDVDGGSRLAKTYLALMNLFKPGTYLIVTRFMLRVISSSLPFKPHSAHAACSCQCLTCAPRTHRNCVRHDWFKIAHSMERRG